MNSIRRPLLAIAVLALGCGDAFAPNVGPLRDTAVADTTPSEGATDSGPRVSFKNDIRPLMNRSETDPKGHGCKRCHYSTEASHVGLDLGGLDLASLGALRKGGGSTGREVVVPFNAEKSGIVQKLKGVYPFGTRMPKNGPAFWSDEDIQKVVDWINQGAEGADDE